MYHDPNVSIEIDNLEQKSRAELRVLWEGEVAGKAPPSLGRDILALAIAYVRQERRYGGLARPVAIAVAAVLTQVHRRGLVHKDIKPANILVNRDRTGQAHRFRHRFAVAATTSHGLAGRAQDSATRSYSLRALLSRRNLRTV
jgi:serine/threonine protein kinase